VLEVFNRPANAEVAGIVRVETLQPGRVVIVSDGLATVEVGTARLVTRAARQRARCWSACGARTSSCSATAGSAACAIVCRLASPCAPVLMRVELDAGFPLFAVVTRPACEELGLRPGENVTALIKAPQFISFRANADAHSPVAHGRRSGVRLR
jgi:molybdate transport system ATP-binding protein